MFIVWSFNLDFEDDTNKRDTVKNKDKRSYKFASRICKISKVKFRIAWLEIL